MDTADTPEPEEQCELAPAYDTWTPCEDRSDPDSWEDVDDEPYAGDYHDPEADSAHVD